MAMPIKIFVTNNETDSAAPRTEGVAVSSTDTYYSKMWTGEGTDAYDLQVSWTGTPAGTLTLQVSNKEHPDEDTDTDWVTDTEATMTDPAGSAAQFRQAVTGSPAYRKRLKYVNASGSGVLYGWVTVPRWR